MLRSTIGRPISCGLLVLALLGLAQTILGQHGPPISYQPALLFTWPTTEARILVEAPTVDGPWVPSLTPVTRFGAISQATVVSSEPMQMFQTHPGWQFMDDFNDGNAEGWELYYGASCLAEVTTATASSGAYRIEYQQSPDGPACALNAGLQFSPLDPELSLANLAASVDLLDWTGKLQLYFLFRADVPSFSSYYGAGLSVESSPHPGFSSLWVYERSPGVDGVRRINPIPTVDPSKNYRLRLSVVGEAITLSLFELNEGEELAGTVTMIDDTLGQGGLVLGDLHLSDSGSFTIDNFILSGTAP